MSTGGLIPQLQAECRVHHGDRSQEIRLSVIWLRIRVRFGLLLPWRRTWSPW